MPSEESHTLLTPKLRNKQGHSCLLKRSKAGVPAAGCSGPPVWAIPRKGCHLAEHALKLKQQHQKSWLLDWQLWATGFKNRKHGAGFHLQRDQFTVPWSQSRFSLLLQSQGSTWDGRNTDSALTPGRLILYPHLHGQNEGCGRGDSRQEWILGQQAGKRKADKPPRGATEQDWGGREKES